MATTRKHPLCATCSEVMMLHSPCVCSCFAPRLARDQRQGCHDVRVRVRVCGCAGVRVCGCAGVR
eukprot:5588443-Amphidinium_carterae.1